MEVEHYPKWKETIGGTDFPLPWLWEEEWDLKLPKPFSKIAKQETSAELCTYSMLLL